MKISGIYKIQSLIKPERIYIGSSVNISYRWSQHLNNLRKGTHHSKKLQNHFNKYGETDLQFSIVLGCDKSDLQKIEQYYLDSYNCYFNICLLAGCTVDKKNTKESNKKRSLKLKGIAKSESTKIKMHNAQLGNKKGLGVKRIFSKTHCENMSKAKKNITDETRKKYKEAQLGERNHNYGKPKSSEVKIKLSESGKKGWIARRLKYNKDAIYQN